MEKRYLDEALKLDSSFQLLAMSFYLPCPQPDQAIGMPPHRDRGLFSFIINNGVAGLQIECNGEWFNAYYPHNSILVVVADQLEVFSNGRCKSVKHRGVVNDTMERIEIVMTNGPVGPADSLVVKDGSELYRSMKYVDYIESLATQISDKSPLEQMMIQDK
ncbi:hypothetical protein BUALT_Bualt15G0064900 [Buddleja alternifolia]|uniref:Fe2OG dioxygenase domain-containing protein n=1 Tax=Buddleja alternifolia TaxID=168488 RepID=A0AAV6WD60_9LAMI|nr:hypothetical protein BUALT_Bualt15G0064900 [Buddleja alternifolia]